MKEHFLRPERSEMIPVSEAAGRINASPVYSPETMPQCRIATMDGTAVHSADTRIARDQAPSELEDSVKINTGQPVPGGYDAIIPSEEIWMSPSGKILIRKPARPSQNIRETGDEIRKGRLILPYGHRIIPSDIGALLTYGISTIRVRSLIAGLIPTGDELILPSDFPGPGQVRESNTAMIAACLRQAGVSPVCHDIIPDEPDSLRQAIASATQECDIVIVSAGSSAGSRDYTREVIEELGSIQFHGVAIKPGKTLLCGDIEGKPVIGLPGQPVAALTAWREVVQPFIRSWGFQSPSIPTCTARVAEPIPSDGGIDEYVFVSVIGIRGEKIVLPRPRGPGGQMHGIRSNGILHIPAQKEGYPEGATVTVRLIRETDDDCRNILLCGPAGIITDLLEVECSSEDISTSIRAMSEIGAAAALCKENCHGIILSGSPDIRKSEVYNLFISACPDPLVVVNICSLQYGICSPRKLTPADIPDLKVVYYPTEFSPQAEVLHAGCLRAAGDENSVINAIKAGETSAGFCTEAKAYEAGLYFLPVHKEPLVLVFREKPEIIREISPFIRFLSSDQWHQNDHLPQGYTTDRAGEVICHLTQATREESGKEMYGYSIGIKP
jgi:putative molybdopterin biosynthesis protein